jgi:hypothetical protein
MTGWRGIAAIGSALLLAILMGACALLPRIGAGGAIVTLGVGRGDAELYRRRNTRRGNANLPAIESMMLIWQV